MEYLKQIGALNPAYMYGSAVVLFLVIFVRYLIFSGVYHYFFYTWMGSKFQHRFLSGSKLKKGQIKKEVYRSALSAAIFTVLGMGMIILWQRGHTAIYTQLDAYPLWYTALSIVFVLFIQDTFYYWLHRWMHLPRIYKWIHKAHHMSLHTSAFTSFSFHPIESLLQAILIPLLVLWMPLNIWVILGILIFMTLSATISHGGVELLTLNRSRYGLSKWLIGAAHHDDHHKKFNYNYGLYFTFWDAWMGTEAPEFNQGYKEPTRKGKAP
jgi:sterol desaturase/sphingolipid hydroxylase (fatty acid hydroxylase superfamily)